MARTARLLLEAYDALGGLEGAIAREAELVAGLPPPLREALPGLLLALVEVDEQKEAVTARTIRRDALLVRPPYELADRLIAGRFVVADGSSEVRCCASRMRLCRRIGRRLRP